MRYLPISQLKQGMVLAIPYYGHKSEVLLAAGTVLSDEYIRRIKGYGYAGVYVEDKFSSGIVIKDILPHEIRVDALEAVKKLFLLARQSSQRKRNYRLQPARQLERLVHPVVESIIANPNHLVEMVYLKPYEAYIYHHSVNSMVYSILVGIEMGLSNSELHNLGLAALVHDVGSAFIPDAILDKPGPLTETEYDVVKSHVTLGFEFLRRYVDFSSDVHIVALQHHEWFDGSGYPCGLAGEEISLTARIVSAASVIDSLVSERPFRGPMLPGEALEHLKRYADTQFDPQVVQALEAVIPSYPSGFCVELDNGSYGIVMENFYGDLQRPRIKMISQPWQYKVVDLHQDPAYKNRHVKQVVGH